MKISRFSSAGVVVKSDFSRFDMANHRLSIHLDTQGDQATRYSQVMLGYAHGDNIRAWISRLSCSDTSEAVKSYKTVKGLATLVFKSAFLYNQIFAKVLPSPHDAFSNISSLSGIGEQYATTSKRACCHSDRGEENHDHLNLMSHAL